MAKQNKQNFQRYRTVFKIQISCINYRKFSKFPKMNQIKVIALTKIHNFVLYILTVRAKKENFLRY